MSVKKLSVDVKERIRGIITNRAVGGTRLNDEEIASYQGILDDTDFWSRNNVKSRMRSFFFPASHCVRR
jgi:hypothetical protein